MKFQQAGRLFGVIASRQRAVTTARRPQRLSTKRGSTNDDNDRYKKRQSTVPSGSAGFVEGSIHLTLGDLNGGYDPCATRTLRTRPSSRPVCNRTAGTSLCLRFCSCHPSNRYPPAKTTTGNCCHRYNRHDSGIQSDAVRGHEEDPADSFDPNTMYRHMRQAKRSLSGSI